MKNFWKNLPKPFFALAPMEAVTDVVFRHVVAAAAKPDVFFTEFVNASSFCSIKGKISTRGRLAFTNDEQPIVAQIWGNKPDEIKQMAQALAKKGFAGIDINMGCPERSVVRNGSGSGLIHTPDLACELIAAAKSSGLPISVKTRLGDTKVEQWREWLTVILQQDIVNLTVHLRTRKEMSKVAAHYELIPEIIKLRDEVAPQTLITINGDIRDRKHGEELAKQYGVDGIMIGRGVFQNPFAFEKLNNIAYDQAGKQNIIFSKHLQPERDRAPGPLLVPGAKPFSKNNILIPKQNNRLLTLLNYHLDLHDKYSTELEPRKFDPLKHFFKVYIHGFPGASELREKLMHTKSTDEVRDLISNLQ